jgi:hypothetical protein
MLRSSMVGVVRQLGLEILGCNTYDNPQLSLSETHTCSLGFEKGERTYTCLSLPLPFSSPLAHTPPSPPSPLYFLALPS